MSSRRMTTGFLVLLLTTGPRIAHGAGRLSAVAVFPVENLSTGPAPTKEVRQFLIERLVAEGIDVLGDDALEAFMVRHRIRYAAGIDSATGQRLRQETGVDGVVIASVELSSDIAPPKVALMARLVSIRDAPQVVWADDVGMAGDDAPGLLELGLVNDHQVLLNKALSRLARSLLGYLSTGEARAHRKLASKFRPQVAYQGLRLEPGRRYTVAVLPFFNLSERRNAGEILAWLFMRHLSALPALRVIDTGEVRQQLLRVRVIMDGGVSISDADLVGTVLDADLILAGRVLYYQDYDGPESNPRVDFSTVVIERKSRKVVWSSHSYRDGYDGVRFFGRGRSATAHAMCTQMVGLATEMIAGGGR